MGLLTKGGAEPLDACCFNRAGFALPRQPVKLPKNVRPTARIPSNEPGGSRRPLRNVVSRKAYGKQSPRQATAFLQPDRAGLGARHVTWAANCSGTWPLPELLLGDVLRSGAAPAIAWARLLDWPPKVYAVPASSLFLCADLIFAYTETCGSACLGVVGSVGPHHVLLPMVSAGAKMSHSMCFRALGNKPLIKSFDYLIFEDLFHYLFTLLVLTHDCPSET